MFASLQDLVSLQLSLPFEDACFALEIEDIVPSTCQGNGERQMDARGRVSAPSKSALMQLSSELLVLILEQVGQDRAGRTACSLTTRLCIQSTFHC